jgi:Na+/H+-dicarboxylate symporter
MKHKLNDWIQALAPIGVFSGIFAVFCVAGGSDLNQFDVEQVALGLGLCIVYILAWIALYWLSEKVR